MKKHLFALFAFVALACSVEAQTTNQTNLPGLPPIAQEATNTANFLTAPGATNWMGVVYVAHSDTDKSWGAGVGLTYQMQALGGMVQPWMRIEALGGSLYQAFGGATLQPPRSIAGKWWVVPFGITGITSQFNGANSFNPIFNAGGGFYATIYKRLGVITTFETANGGKYKWDTQERGGLTYSW